MRLWPFAPLKPAQPTVPNEIELVATFVVATGDRLTPWLRTIRDERLVARTYQRPDGDQMTLAIEADEP